MKLAISILFCSSVLCSCANNLAANRISAESYANDEQKTSYSRVFAWDSKYSAGIGNSHGLCAQGALTSEASAIGAAIEATAKKPDITAKGALQATESVSALNVSNAQTAFANIGYFYACQIALNHQSSTAGKSQLDSKQIVELFKLVSEAAPKINSGEGVIALAKADQLEAFKAYLERIGADVPSNLEQAIEEAQPEVTDEAADETP